MPIIFFLSGKSSNPTISFINYNRLPHLSRKNLGR